MARRNGTSMVSAPTRPLLLAGGLGFQGGYTGNSAIDAESLEHALKQLRFKAREALGKAGIGPDDLDDLVQDMALDILECLPKFDPSKATLRTFVARVAEQRIRKILRHRTRAMRDRRREACSLNGLVDDGDGGAVELAQAVSQEEQNLRAGRRRLSEAARIDLQVDVTRVLSALPSELQRLGELLKTYSLTEAAQELGVPRSTLYGMRLARLREVFAEHGLGSPRSPRPPRSPSGDPRMTLPAVFQRRANNAAILSDLSFLIREPAEVYHGKAKEFLSSHQLGNFRKCPLLFARKRKGLIPDEDRPAYLLGRAAHTLILEGREVYEREYAVGGPTNERTGERYGSRTQKFAEWAAAQGKPVLTDEQALLVENLAASVRGHEQAAALLAGGVAEGVVRAEYQGEPCQVRIDWLNPERGLIDLKSADDLDWFEADARRYGYCHQVAFYRALLATVTGVLLPCHVIAVEKHEPFRTGVWRVGEDVLGIAQQDNEKAIARLRACREKDEWPTLFETVRTFDWL